MSQVGRISGPLLTANLERNGINLAFRNNLSTTQLLYLDVNSGKISVNKSTSGYELEVNGTARSTNLISTTNSIAAGGNIAGSPEYTATNEEWGIPSTSVKTISTD